MDCANKIGLVTGAAAGIGRACAIALAQAGAQVIATDIDEAGLAKTLALIEKSGGKARIAPQDVRAESVWASLIADIKKTEGGLNILVNNAGIGIAAPLISMSLEDFRRQMAINVDGVFLGCKHAIPLMGTSGKSSIINISSVAGLIGAPGLTGYCASKGAVRLFTKAAALECAAADLSIRVNSVHPGIIDTDIWGKEIAGLADLSENLSHTAKTGANRVDIEAFSAAVVPGGKPGQPIDIANGVVFLASDASSYMNGTELVIDYGQTA